MNYLECTPTFLMRGWDYFWCIFLYFYYHQKVVYSDQRTNMQPWNTTWTTMHADITSDAMPWRLPVIS